MSAVADVRPALIGHLKELHLPTFRTSFEELARQAQQEGHSYERYLLELAQRETQERQGKRIERLLRQSQLPLLLPLAEVRPLALRRLTPAFFRRWMAPRVSGRPVFQRPVVLASPETRPARGE